MPIIGEAYRELQEIVKSYANENLPVLFSGETGTGKELFMQLYKESNPRTGKKMTINCAAVSENLLWSEVFGHAKGSFTGADKNRLGKIATCENGILALDEIGDASPEFQAAILRVSEANSFSSLGSDDELKTDTLIIAATNRLEKVRHDLRERFHILPIPPLQKDDIPAIVSHFLKKPLTEEVIQELTFREYSGNIRELKRACERLKAELGDSIFSKKSNNVSLNHFDYNRFRREINTWDRYVQPLIGYYGEKHGFEKYKYRYMPWDGDSLKWILCRDEHLNPNAVKTELDVKEYDVIIRASNMYVFMAFLKRSINEEYDLPLSDNDQFILEKMTPKEIMKNFVNYLRYAFDRSILPCLLGYIYLKAEIPSMALLPAVPEPYLSYLLNLPLKQAEKEFVQHYYDYNIKKYPDKSKLESVTGMTKKALDQRSRRYK